MGSQGADRDIYSLVFGEAVNNPNRCGGDCIYMPVIDRSFFDCRYLTMLWRLCSTRWVVRTNELMQEDSLLYNAIVIYCTMMEASTNGITWVTMHIMQTLDTFNPLRCAQQELAGLSVDLCEVTASTILGAFGSACRILFGSIFIGTVMAFLSAYLLKHLHLYRRPDLFFPTEVRFPY